MQFLFEEGTSRGSCCLHNQSQAISRPHFATWLIPFRRERLHYLGRRYMQKRSGFIALLCCLLLLASSIAFGQATASSGIQGTIVDKSQAAIAGAEVTVTNKATGAARTTKTNELGAFRLDLLPAGVYNLRATASGFSTAEA